MHSTGPVDKLNPTLRCTELVRALKKKTCPPKIEKINPPNKAPGVSGQAASSDPEIKKLEYQMAHEMLRHYDTLNWQIGSILIAGVLVLTGLIINKDAIELMGTSLAVGLGITLGLPAISFLILRTWLSWFARHQQLYNFRNEVLHRLEFQLKMYHNLKVAEAKLKGSDAGDASRQENDASRQENLERLRQARLAAGYAPTPQDIGEAGAQRDENEQAGGFQPIFNNEILTGSSGSVLAKRLAWGIPMAQLLLLGYILAVFHVPRLIRICICP